MASVKDYTCPVLSRVQFLGCGRSNDGKPCFGHGTRVLFSGTVRYPIDSPLWGRGTPLAKGDKRVRGVFAEPSQWYDYKLRKASASHLDFKHRETDIGPSLDGRLNPLFGRAKAAMPTETLQKQSLEICNLARTLYLVDVHPLCYEGKKPRPTAILNWMRLLFDQVSLSDPVIAVMDGERGNEYRKRLFPSYKEKRNKYKPMTDMRGPYFKGDQMDLREAFPYIYDFFLECNVQVLKIEDAEADDVIATLMWQALNKSMKVVVASPDMDYRQLLCDDVKMVLPLPEFGRWSFYTLQQYRAEHNCDPQLDLGLRCMLGDQSDSVPGLPDLAPGFGRKTALKLIKKHGSLENLLLAAKTRTVGKPYIQEALALHRDVLYRNLQILSFRRDVDVMLEDEWCKPRDRSAETRAFGKLQDRLQDKKYNSGR